MGRYTSSAGPSGALLGRRGTECSAVLFTSPSTLSRELSHEPSGNRVLGGCHVQPRALSPEHFCTDPRGTERSGAAARSPPSALSRNLTLLIIGGLGCSGATRHLPEHFLPGT